MKTTPKQPVPPGDVERDIREGFKSGETAGWIDGEEVMKRARAILKKHERKLKKAA